MEDDVKSDSNSGVESEHYEHYLEGERYDPLGAASDSELELRCFQDRPTSFEESERILDLEQEQEKLTGSLLALTSHFGQVQFRLKQIIDIGSTASKDQWTDLLRQLEDFAFQGIPEVQQPSETNNSSTDEEKANAATLEELQQPQTILLEKQKILIEELKKKLNLPIDELKLPTLSMDELKDQVDKLMNPIEMKDTLVNQLKTQIVDLERFINFIQNEDEEMIPENFLLEKTPNCDCSSETHTKKILQRKNSKSKMKDADGQDGQPVTNFEHRFERDPNWQRRRPEPGFLPRMAQLFDMFTYMGGSSSEGFRKNVLKKTARGNHWGDIRAQFELDVEEVCAHMTAAVAATSFKSKSSRGCSATERRNNSAILTNLVRKRMAISLRNLIQHGIKTSSAGATGGNGASSGSTSTMMVPFISCFGMPRAYENNYMDQRQPDANESSVHAWDLILEYYYMQNGDKFNETPAVKLSQSFNLDLVSEAGGSTTKQSLLSHIGNVISIHLPYKSSHNAHFKSFICAALNTKNLGKWMKLICQQTSLVGAYYESWSYMLQTGFRDSFKTMEKLSAFAFQLPVDQAVRQFESINDVFM